MCAHKYAYAAGFGLLKGAVQLFQHIPQMNIEMLAGGRRQSNAFTNSHITFLGKLFYCIILLHIMISVPCSTKSTTNLHLHKDKTF